MLRSQVEIESNTEDVHSRNAEQKTEQKTVEIVQVMVAGEADPSRDLSSAGRERVCRTW